MKVLFINSVCGIRSTGRIVTDLAEQYMADGHECEIAYGREFAPEKYKNISYKIGSNFSVKLNALSSRLLDNDGFTARRATKRFLKWADNYDPDVLWLHNLHGYYINIELLFEWIKSRPQMKVKWSLHDCWAFTGHCTHFSYVKCYRWQQECYNCIQKREYPESWLRDGSNQNFHKKKNAFCGVNNMTLITPSNWLSNLVKQSFLSAYPVKVIYNTIDETTFKPSESNFREKMNLCDKKIVLGVASSWSDRKGLKDFIALATMLDNKHRVVLVGIQDFQKKQLPPTIICVPPTNSKKELAEIYTAADVFLNLTYEDTYPTVNLEAQACGTPCITYNTGGSVESVPCYNVVEPGNLNDIIDKINNICWKDTK